MAKFSFRHGIARRQQDGTGNPNNLLPTSGGSWLDLIVSPDPTIFLCAHYDVDYMQTENVTVSQAWGPFVSGTDYWIYWDIDFQTGALTRQYTTVEPVEANTEPPPILDQHWFDTNEKVMKVWTGASWIEKIRVFAAKYASGATILYEPLGSQVGLDGLTVFAGKILFDPDGMPLQKFQRNRRGQFITTETDLNSQFNRIANFRVEAAIVQGEAQEYIPISYAVALSDFDQLVLARSSNTSIPAIGIATEDMYPGEVRSYITKGFITNEVSWDWSAYPAHTLLFVGDSGQLLPAPEASATTQQEIGYIVNQTTIYVNVGTQVDLEPPNDNELGLMINRDSGQRIGRKIPFTIADLNDTDIYNPQDGDVIIWDDTSQKWVLESNCCDAGGAQYMNDLLDVISLPSEGDVLVYRGTFWVSEPSTGTDEFVKASATDTITGHLDAKVVAGSGISLNILNPGGDEQIELSAPGSSASGLFVTNVTLPGSGIIGNYVYAPNTVPANTVVTEATSDTSPVRVEFIVEGDGSTYSPSVIVDVGVGNIPGILTQDPQDIRTFHGYADVTIADGLTTGRIVELEASHGATAQVLVKRASAAAEVRTVAFDNIYPAVPADPPSGYLGGVQTTIKSGDTFFVSGSADNEATLIILNTGDAVGSGTFTTATVGGFLGAVDSAGAGYRTFTIQFTASSASGVQTADAVAQNSFGTLGSPVTTINTVTMDQIAPSVNIASVTYPIGQSALKNAEIATISNTASDYDYIYYYENGGAGFISVTNPNTYEPSKTVTRIGGNYVYNGNNFAMMAYKTTNGSSTTDATGDVNISNVAPTVNIAGAASRLISSPSGEDYTITLTFSQELLQAPTITSSGDPTAGDRGVWSGAGPTWSFTLNVDDADIKDNYDWTVDNVNTLSDSTYNGVTISSGDSYEIGGFTSRFVTVGALEQVVDLNVDITDPSKVVVKYAGTTDNLTYRGSDLSLFQKGWSAVDGSQLIFTPGAEPFPNYSNFVFQDPTGTPTSWLFLTDSDFAGANTSGTLQLEIVEGA